MITPLQPAEGTGVSSHFGSGFELALRPRFLPSSNSLNSTTSYLQIQQSGAAGVKEIVGCIPLVGGNLLIHVGPIFVMVKNTLVSG